MRKKKVLFTLYNCQPLAGILLFNLVKKINSMNQFHLTNKMKC